MSEAAAVAVEPIPAPPPEAPPVLTREEQAAALIGNLRPEEDETNAEAAELVEAATADGEPKPDKEAENDNGKKKDAELSAPNEKWTKERVEEERGKVEADRKSLEAETDKLKASVREHEQKRLEFIKKAEKLDGRERKLNHKIQQKTEQWKQQESVHNWVSAQVRALREGDAETRIKALGALANTDGAKLYEELTLGIASNGKKTAAATDPYVRQLEERLARFERAQAEGQQRAQTEAQQRAAAEHTQRWRDGVLVDARSTQNQSLLLMISRDAEHVADEAVREAELFYQQFRRPIDRPSLLAKLEEKFRKRLELPQPGQGTQTTESAATASGADTTREIVATAQPETPQRSAKAQSVPQSLGSSGRTRPMSEAERLKAAAALIDFPDR